MNDAIDKTKKIEDDLYEKLIDRQFLMCLRDALERRSFENPVNGWRRAYELASDSIDHLDAFWARCNLKVVPEQSVAFLADCPDCHEEYPLTADGLITHHDVDTERGGSWVTCSGAGKKPAP